jgi:protein SCO1/2
VNKRKLLNYGMIAALMTALFFVGLKLGGTRTSASAEPQKAPPGAALVSPPTQPRDFTLTDQHGQPVSLSSLRGKTVGLFFGYTHCPDVCSATLAYFTQMKRALGEQADQVAFVFITVDSQRDTPAAITTYLSAFDASFIRLSGDEALLTQVAAQFGSYFWVEEKVGAEKVQPTADHSAHGHGDSASESAAHGDTPHVEDVDSDNYFVDHTSPTYLIDAAGFLRYVYFYSASPEDMTTGLRTLIGAQ